MKRIGRIEDKHRQVDDLNYSAVAKDVHEAVDLNLEELDDFANMLLDRIRRLQEGVRRMEGLRERLISEMRQSLQSLVNDIQKLLEEPS